jgi:hypothetical protein
MNVIVTVMSEDGKQVYNESLEKLVTLRFPKGVIKFGIFTECFDRSGLAIYSDSFVYYKQELCRIALVEGQFMIIGPMLPLTVVCKEVDVL